MSRFSTVVALAGVLALASTADAQGTGRAMGPPNGAPGMPAPGARMGGPPMGAPMMDVASMLLAHTGDFKLTDQQVTRLAAISRRTADRRKTMMASVDSMRAKRAAAPAPAAGALRTPPEEARAFATKMRDQSHADLRDAIAILTPDQQAMGWEMMARQGAGGRTMGRRMGMSMGRGRGMGAGMSRGPGQEGPMSPRRNGMEPRPRRAAPAPAPASDNPVNY
ncbi:MAG: Spy/CpxP family protein refolding chaperone [bacterium]